MAKKKRKQRGDTMQDVTQKPQASEAEEAVETMEAAVETAMDADEAHEQAKEEMAQDTAAAEAAETPRGVVVQDTAWEGYEEIPAWIMQGYGTMASEAAEALAAAIAKQEEYLAMAQRVQADFENFRRRNQNVRKEAFDDGARAFATTLLPVIDNLERAITAAGENAGEGDSLKSGVEMVLRQMCEAFEKRGITPISRQGEKFDPNLENAVMQGAPEDGEPGTVCEVLLKGYQMEGTVLRHAMVKVVPE